MPAPDASPASGSDDAHLAADKTQTPLLLRMTATTGSGTKMGVEPTLAVEPTLEVEPKMERWPTEQHKWCK